MNTLAVSNISCLRQGIELLRNLPEGFYSKPCAEVFGSTIGGHLRHNLDHYKAFMTGMEPGWVDYDARSRDTSIETRPDAAIHLIENLIEKLGTVSEADFDRELQIRMDDGGSSSWSKTTLRRELQFLLSHTIHHYALIASIARRFGFTRLPAEFGIAPSTLSHVGEKTN
ncbi:MAG: DinB family protein [Oceanipulchritudo sp.]